MSKDLEHLRLLSIFHFVCAGITTLFGSLPLIHVFMGVMVVTGQFESGANPPPPWFGWFFIGIGSILILFFWALAIAMLINGIFLRKRKNRIFCLAVAGLECIVMPFGTVLGIFTIIVLLRDSVKELFVLNQAAR